MASFFHARNPLTPESTGLGEGEGAGLGVVEGVALGEGEGEGSAQIAVAINAPGIPVATTILRMFLMAGAVWCGNVLAYH